MGSQQNQPTQNQPPGQNQPGQGSSLVNLLHSNSEQSPYSQNQAKSPASQMNGNIMSPTPSQVRNFVLEFLVHFYNFNFLATRWSTIDSAISTRICANNAIWTSATFTCTYKSNDTSKSRGSKYSWWTK